MLGSHAHYLVDLAVLLYAVGMQVAYQRMSSMVRFFPFQFPTPALSVAPKGIITDVHGVCDGALGAWLSGGARAGAGGE